MQARASTVWAVDWTEFVELLPSTTVEDGVISVQTCTAAGKILACAMASVLRTTFQAGKVSRLCEPHQDWSRSGALAALWAACGILTNHARPECSEHESQMVMCVAMSKLFRSNSTFAREQSLVRFCRHYIVCHAAALPLS